MLYIAGEDIPAGSPVVECVITGKLYAAGERAGTYLADSVENLREGFRVHLGKDGLREDDA